MMSFAPGTTADGSELTCDDDNRFSDGRERCRVTYDGDGGNEVGAFVVDASDTLGGLQLLVPSLSFVPEDAEDARLALLRNEAGQNVHGVAAATKNDRTGFNHVVNKR